MFFRKTSCRNPQEEVLSLCLWKQAAVSIAGVTQNYWFKRAWSMSTQCTRAETNSTSTGQIKYHFWSRYFNSFVRLVWNEQKWIINHKSHCFLLRVKTSAHFYVKIIYFFSIIYIKEDVGNPSFVQNAKQR